ncbi:MAG: hypothetical protein ACJ0OQ_03045 [Candidatus Marisimplicoccus sp.]|tara:strand:+ start:361 stop:642 length:282 start_codon:yes stop_codon:yes gene_type:complete
MRKIILITFCFLFFACNTNEKNTIKWTEDEKDLTYKECITYAMDIRGMDIDKSDAYCQCNIDVLVSNFKNNEDARIKIGNDTSLRSMFDVCDN